MILPAGPASLPAMIRLPPPGLLAFAAATLLPLALLAAGAGSGAAALAALIYLTGLTLLLDQLVPAAAGEGAEFPGADALLIALALGHVALLPLTVAAVAGESVLSPGERAALALAAGLWIGQVAVPAAHELIHRPDRRLFWLGAAVYAVMLFGHHASAHRLVHHTRAASPADPNTARQGESFYRFFARAWRGSFVEGLRAETALRQGRSAHPYLIYGAISVAGLGVAFWLAGLAGAAVWAGVSLHGQVQLLLADYVQHYGLIRATRPDGRRGPLTVAHAWNAPHWFSGVLTLQAARHSDHHLNPARPYPALRLPPDAPALPCALPLACTLALVPPLWRRVMHPRLARWRAAS